MKKLKYLLFCLIVIMTFSNINVFANEIKMSDEYSYLDRMFGYASELYVDESLDKDELLKKAINKYLEENPEVVIDIVKAGFSSIDDYTEFYTFEEYIGFVTEMNHTFYGIGVIVQKIGDYVEITTVLEDGSAKDAGLMPGDKISIVDGVDMKSKNIDEVQSAIVGDLGTSVVITVIRDNYEYTYEMIRGPVNNRTVNYLALDDNVAYINIINFAENTATEFKEVLDDLKEQGIFNIILDLRYNPGGYLQSAVDIAQWIIPEGIIVQTMYRQSDKNKIYYSELKKPEYNFAVLVNEYTASAAEILTSAIQDSGIGTIIGETTYGKGVIQDVFTMKDTNTFKITTGRYLTRNGREIDQKGIEPDIYIVNTTEPVDVTKYAEIVYSNESKFGQVNDNLPQIKQRLQILGYAIGNISNVFDNELEAAVLEFQIDNNIVPTGRLDRITMVQIENSFANSEVFVDSQLYEAYGLFGGDREFLDEILGL